MKRLRLLLKILRHGEKGFYLYKAEELKKKLEDLLVPREQYPAYLDFALDIGKEAWAARMTGAFLRVTGLTYSDLAKWRQVRGPDTQIR